VLDRVGHFVGFLDGVRCDGREILRPIPRASGFRVAQLSNDVQQALDVVGGDFFIPLKKNIAAKAAPTDFRC
jgi:hypothetical protein